MSAPEMAQAARYTPNEELANGLSHGLGVILGVIALVVLCTYASHTGSALHVIGCAIYGSTLILLYSASTLYHFAKNPRTKELLRAFDHSAIFLLIAGTYTPFCLVTLSGVWGWSMLVAVWTLAVLGIGLRLKYGRKQKAAAVTIYLLMGWLIVIAFKPMLAATNSTALLLLGAGGLAYTLGVGFYVWHRLPYHHAIWHLFVLTASVLHFFAVFYGVLLPPAN